MNSILSILCIVATLLKGIEMAPASLIATFTSPNIITSTRTIFSSDVIIVPNSTVIDVVTNNIVVVSPEGDPTVVLFQGKSFWENLSPFSLGSCGIPLNTINGTYGNWVVGLSNYWMPTTGNPNNNLLCPPGSCILATGPKGSVVVKITDTLPNGGTETNRYDINLSEKAFAAIGNLDDGIIPVSWEFVACEKYRLGKQ